MKIGDLAAASSTAIDTIRYHERESLLPEPRRNLGAGIDRPRSERLVKTLRTGFP